MENAADQYVAQLSAVMQNLEARASSLNAKKIEYEALIKMLTQLPEQLSHDVMVPVAGCAFFPGKIVHTNEIMVLLGENYFAERSASQAQQIVQRRLDCMHKESFPFSTTDVALVIHENIATLERQLAAFSGRKQVMEEYQSEGIVDIQEPYNSDDEEAEKKNNQAVVDEEEMTRRRNLFIKEVKSEKIDKTDEEFIRLEKRLQELQEEEERAERAIDGGDEGARASAADVSNDKVVIVDSLDEEEGENEEEEEEEEEEEGDAFDQFYDENENVSDEGEEAEAERFVEDHEEENVQQPTKALKSVHLRTQTPPANRTPTTATLKSVHARTNTPPKAAAKPKPAPAPPPPAAATTETPSPAVVIARQDDIEPIEPKKVTISTQNLPPFVRPPVLPGKLKPCLAPPRPITVAAPPSKEVRWTHVKDEDLPKYKNRPVVPPPAAVVGNRPRASTRGTPLPTPQVLQSAAAVAAIGEVVERNPATPVEEPAATAEAPRRVSRYRAAMENRH